MPTSRAFLHTTAAAGATAFCGTTGLLAAKCDLVIWRCSSFARAPFEFVDNANTLRTRGRKLVAYAAVVGGKTVRRRA